jgi:TolA-binding protein
MTAAAAAVAVAAAALFLLIPRRPAGRLRVQVGSAAETMAAVPSLVADARADLPLRFSDGSAVVFRAGSAGRLESLTASGSELVLEHGTLTAHVVHAATTAWVVHAGPYRVRVTGTRFAVSWRAGRLDLSLFEGSVIVDGSVLGVGVPLTAGRRLTVASGIVRIEPFQAEGPPLRTAQQTARGDGAPEGAGEVDRAGRSTGSGERAVGGAAPAGDEARSDGRAPRLAPTLALADGPRASDTLAQFAGQSVPGAQEDLMTDEPAAAAGAAEGTTAPTRRRHTRAARAGVGGARSADEGWLALAEDRHYPEALAAARRLGWSNLCRHLDAHRLLTLADVARYSGARAPARRAFEALARRFPHDRLAGDAVFSLGRMAFEAGHAAEAARWFRRYGADWPNGPLADEAAGRLVESAIRLQDAEAARAAAHAYLARAPHGPQASLARGVLADSPNGAP